MSSTPAAPTAMPHNTATSALIKTGDVTMEKVKVVCCFLKKQYVLTYTWTLRENGVLTQVLNSGTYKNDNKHIWDMRTCFATIPTSIELDVQVPETRALQLSTADGKRCHFYIALTETDRDDWLVRFKALNSAPLPAGLAGNSLEMVVSDKVTKYVDNVIKNAVAESQKVV